MHLVILVFLLVIGISTTTGPLTPILLSVKCAQKLKAGDQERGDLVFKLVASLVIWGALSLVMLFLCFWMMMAVGHSSGERPLDEGDYWQLLVISVIAIVYAFVCGGLVYWVTRERRPVST